jgi:hypothetical protein
LRNLLEAGYYIRTVVLMFRAAGAEPSLAIYDVAATIETPPA